MNSIARLNGKSGARTEAQMARADRENCELAGDMTNALVFARFEAIALTRVQLMGAVAVSEQYRRTQWEDAAQERWTASQRINMVRDCSRIIARCEADRVTLRQRLTDLEG